MNATTLKLDKWDARVVQRALTELLCHPLGELTQARAEDILDQLAGRIARQPRDAWRKVGKEWHYYSSPDRHTGIVKRGKNLDGETCYLIRQKDLHGWQRLTSTRTLLAAKRRVEHVWTGKCFSRPRRVKEEIS